MRGVVVSVFACSLAVIIAVAIPWRYVFEHYVTRPATHGDGLFRPSAVIQIAAVGVTALRGSDRPVWSSVNVA